MDELQIFIFQSGSTEKKFMVYNGYGGVHYGKSIFKIYYTYLVIYDIDEIDYNIDTWTEWASLLSIFS